MNPNDDPILSSHPSYSPQTDASNPDLDDTDDDCLDSLDEVQGILQTYGANDCSPSSLDYFDSRRYEIMYEMMNLEKQFNELKNILYDESVLFIDRKLVAIQNEEAPEYQHELKKLYDEMNLRLEIAKQRQQIELEALENSMQSELLSLEQTLENDKFLLYHHLQENIQWKIEEFEALKSKAELCAHILQEIHPQEEQRHATSTNRKRVDGLDSTRSSAKKRRVNGTTKAMEKDNLAIFYQLSEINVIEDWALIQTSLQPSSATLEESDNRHNSEESDKEDAAHRLVMLSEGDNFQEERIDCDQDEA
jgi:hypothetical protein